MKKNDLPAMPLYWGDIFKASDVMSLPKDIRDTFWLCLGRMWESNPRGYLMVNGRKPTDSELASMLMFGLDNHLVNQHLNHLVDATGIFSKNSQGIIFSRRMVNDEKNREIKRNNGKLGGNPSLLVNHVVNQEVILNHENETEYVNKNKDKEVKSKCKKLNTRHAVFENLFFRAHEGVLGKKFIVTNWSKHNALIKKCLKLPIEFEKLQLAIFEFMMDSDKFLMGDGNGNKGAGHGVDMFLFRMGRNVYSEYLTEDFLEANRKNLIEDPEREVDNANV